MPITPRHLGPVWNRGGRTQFMRGRKLHSATTLYRTGGVGKRAFEACVEVGGLPARWNPDARKNRSSFSRACMFGQNPRAALASAFARAARQMKKRSGAFARYR